MYAGFIGGCQDHWFNDGAGQAKMNELYVPLHWSQQLTTPVMLMQQGAAMIWWLPFMSCAFLVGWFGFVVAGWSG